MSPLTINPKEEISKWRSSCFSNHHSLKSTQLAKVKLKKGAQNKGDATKGRTMTTGKRPNRAAFDDYVGGTPLLLINPY